MNSINHPLIRLAFALLCLMVSIALLKSIAGHFRRTDVVGETRMALIKEQKRNQELKERLKEATSEAFVEKQAREKLGMAKDGETIVLMDTSRSVQVGGQDVVKEEKLSNWQRWWRLFF